MRRTVEAAWFKPSEREAVLRASAQPCDPLALPADQLSPDCASDWVYELAAMFREIHKWGDLEDSADEAHIADVDAHRDSWRTPDRSREHIRRVAERYRALLSVNIALTRTLSAVRAHLAHLDEALPIPRGTARKGLTRWQERRARSYLLSNLATRISNADVAAACGLSQNYFVTVFRQSTGETPHACLLRYRVAKAKQLLLGPTAIADIALTCGFGDQSHLTRVFTRHVGIAPGEWRRERRYQRQQDPPQPSRLRAAEDTVQRKAHRGVAA